MRDVLILKFTEHRNYCSNPPLISVTEAQPLEILFWSTSKYASKKIT